MLAYIVLLLLMLLMVGITDSIEGMKNKNAAKPKTSQVVKGGKRVQLSAKDCAKRFKSNPSSYSECLRIMENRSKKELNRISDIPSGVKNVASKAANKAKEVASKAKETASKAVNKVKGILKKKN